MTNSLIGSTGFVGSNLLRQSVFEDCYRSTNISEIEKRSYDLIVCAGAPGTKWKANLYPEEDWESIQCLIHSLKRVQTKRFILISTVDVYPHPVDVNEMTSIEILQLLPYGKHRLYLEHFVRKAFPNYTIIRLPGLFGSGIKKNFIYDLIHRQALHLTDSRSAFQFYNLNNLWKDISILLSRSLPLVNFATEPVSASELAWYTLKQRFENVTEKAARYNMKTIFGKVFGRNSAYIYNKKEILEQIKEFIYSQKGEE